MKTKNLLSLPLPLILSGLLTTSLSLIFTMNIAIANPGYLVPKETPKTGLYWIQSATWLRGAGDACGLATERMAEVFSGTYGTTSMFGLVKAGANLIGVSTSQIRYEREVRALQEIAVAHEYKQGSEQTAWTCGEIAESLIRFENMAIRAKILKP